MKTILFLSLIVGLSISCNLECCESLPSRTPLTYTYYQDTGRFFGGIGEWAISTFGYSGANEHRNKPDSQCLRNQGPAPANVYKLILCQNTMHDPPVKRPCSFWLQGQDEGKMCGRSEIFIHGCQCCTDGDHQVPPTEGCSAGCIIISEENRVKLRVGDTLVVQNYDPNGFVV